MLKDINEIKTFLNNQRKGYREDFEITFIMTTECNFRCTYCYETKYESSINVEDAYSLLDKIFDISSNESWWNGYLKGCLEKKEITFNFFGGECLLEVESMTKICDYFVKKCDECNRPDLLEKWKITIQTNGYLLQTAKVKKFLKKYQNYLSFPFITIDGSKEFHDACRVLKDGKTGTWEKVKENIEWFRKTYPTIPITTKGTITPLTISKLHESFRAYKELGFTSINITLVCDQAWPESCIKIAKEQYALILKDMLTDEYKDVRFARWTDLKKNYIRKDGLRNTFNYGMCYTCGSGITLYPNGNLYPCFAYTPLAMYPTNKNDYFIGTMKEGIITEKKAFTDMLEAMADEKLLTDEGCSVCLAKSKCDYCPASNLKHNGNVDKDSKHACDVIQVEQAYGSAWRYLWEEKYGKDPYWYFND